jgi:hypothetical protein
MQGKPTSPVKPFNSRRTYTALAQPPKTVQQQRHAQQKTPVFVPASRLNKTELKSNLLNDIDGMLAQGVNIQRKQQTQHQAPRRPANRAPATVSQDLGEGKNDPIVIPMEEKTPLDPKTLEAIMGLEAFDWSIDEIKAELECAKAMQQTHAVKTDAATAAIPDVSMEEPEIPEGVVAQPQPAPSYTQTIREANAAHQASLAGTPKATNFRPSLGTVIDALCAAETSASQRAEMHRYLSQEYPFLWQLDESRGVPTEKQKQAHAAKLAAHK